MSKLPKSIIKKHGITKKAWRIYKAQKNKKKSSSTKKTTKKRKVSKRMPKKKRSRRSRELTVPIATVAGLAAGMMEPVEALAAGNYAHALAVMSYNYTGYNPEDGTFNPQRMTRGLLPLLIGASVSKYVGGKPFNLNRRLAAAGLPIIRI